MPEMKISTLVWGAVAGIGLLIVVLLFAWIWLAYTPMWACIISGILSLALGVLSYFAQALIEKPVFGRGSAVVFGILGIGFLAGGAWLQPDANKVPCFIGVLIVALIVFGFGAWKIRDIEREKEILAKRKRR